MTTDVSERVLHCWMGSVEHAEETYGWGSHEWAEEFAKDVHGTCMLPRDHEGPHVFTPDDQIGVSFAKRKD